MNLAILEQMRKDVEAGKAGVLCTVVDVVGSTPRSIGASMWVRPEGGHSGTVGGGVFEHHVIQEALGLLAGAGENKMFREAMYCDGTNPTEAACGGDIAVFLEVVGRERELVVFGAGHVGRAIAHVGSITGFRVTVWDERDEYANDRNIPWARNVACPLNEVFQKGVTLGKHVYAVIVTRGHALDSDVVKLLDGRAAAYIGLIGSRRKIAFVRKNLLAEGVSQAHLDRLFQPVGLPIRAETPEEIAISVMAEIIAVSRDADVPALRKGLETMPHNPVEGA